MTVLEVLAEPNRRRILDLLRDGERPVGDLVQALDIAQPTVSKHLRVLRDAGLVDVRAAAQLRLYRVRPEPLRELDEWLAPYRDVVRPPRCARARRELPPRLNRRTTMSPSPSTTDRLGTLVETPDGWQLRYVRQLPKPPATVWRAFVEPELVDQWFPFSIVGDFVVGSRLRFEAKDFEAEPFDGEVIDVAEPNRLEFSWGPDVLRFALDEIATGTELTLTVLLSEHGRGARDGAGWHECLEHLARVEATDPADVAVETWAQIHPAYVERFGPEASAIGPPQEYLDAHPDAS